ncbi:unnamed protein product, partial [Durusdinium trenchii]
ADWAEAKLTPSHLPPQMTKFEQARAAHNATKAKWQRARELAAQHLEERKQQKILEQEQRRSSKASTMSAMSSADSQLPEPQRGECERTERRPSKSEALEFKPRDRRRSSKTSESTRESVSSEHRIPEGVEDPRGYLWKLGYCRGPPQPELTICVGDEEENHTWNPISAGEDMYNLKCKLVWACPTDYRVSEWTCKKRLSDLRSKIHDHVKKDLGAEYRTYFQDARFAHHGGLPGTRKRLDAWFATLAAIANEGQLRNDLLALLLDQLEAPIPQKVSEEIEQLRTELQNAAKVTNPDDEIRIEQHLPEPEVARPHIAVEHLVVAL